MQNSLLKSNGEQRLKDEGEQRVKVEEKHRLRDNGEHSLYSKEHEVERRELDRQLWELYMRWESLFFRKKISNRKDQEII